MICHSCGEDLKEGLKACPVCGESVREVKKAVISGPWDCISCGEQNDGKLTVCETCGTPREKEAAPVDRGQADQADRSNEGKSFCAFFDLWAKDK